MVQHAPSFMSLIMSNSDKNAQYRLLLAILLISQYFIDFKSICIG